MRDLKRFSKNLLGLAELFKHELSQFSIAFYEKALAEYTDEEVEKAMVEAAKTLRFFPKIVELIELIDGNGEDKALSAWEQLQKAVQYHGRNDSILFTDSKITRVIELMGGWKEVCDWPIEDIKFRRLEFAKIYKSLLDGGPQRPLCGLIEGHNRANGYLGHIPDPVVIGEGPIMIEAKRNQHQKLVDECVDTVLLNSADLKGEI